MFLHGGPGGGTDPAMRRFFDPRRYRIVLFDQRGCGASRPHAALRDNTTWDLIADIEAMRRRLGIERWLVFGGSWGSTLALAYAEQASETGHRAGAARHFPAAALRARLVLPGSAGRWLDLSGPLGTVRGADSRGRARRHDAGLLSPPDLDHADACAPGGARLVHWEGATSYLRTNPKLRAKFDDPDFAAAFARIEVHYFVNRGFFEHDDQLLRDVARIRATFRA